MAESAGPRNFDEEFGLQEKKPVQFVLGGQTFTVRPVLHPAILMQDLDGLEGLLRFIRGCLDAPSREAFQALIDDPDVLVSVDQISAVSSFIVEELSDGRPTASPASSGDGRGNKKGTSKVAALSQAKTGTD